MQVNDSLIDTIADLGHNKGELTPYLMFKYAIKTELTRKYYERRLKKFFDFIEFEIEHKGSLKGIALLSSKIVYKEFPLPVISFSTLFMLLKNSLYFFLYLIFSIFYINSSSCNHLYSYNYQSYCY